MIGSWLDLSKALLFERFRIETRASILSKDKWTFER